KNGDGTFTFTRHAAQTFAFSSTGQLLSERDLNGYTTTLSYNAANQLTAVTDPAGRSLTFSWQGNHIQSVADPVGHTLTYSFNSTGDLSSVTDPGGKQTFFTYDPSHQMLTMQDPRQGVITN